MATNTRVATTIAARYTPNVGAVDAFYLDGRISGKREEHFADLTVDRTDRGSFYAVYASSHGSKNPSDGGDGNRQILDRIAHDLKKNHRHNIDYEINELAESAVNVAGRLTISDDEVTQPYFAGIIIKDGEMAAVTLGRGCAYLYRDEALFPLTEDDFPLEPIDTDGRQISNLNDFSAGVAGAIRYSNIAQLRPDDCIIVCNCDLMEAIGQKVMLQLLDEAEDQCDAAGLIMSEAVQRNSRTAMQIMIGFIEELEPLDRVGRNTLAKGLNVRDTLGKGVPTKTGPVTLSKGPRNTGSLTPEERAQIEAAVKSMEADGTPPQRDRDGWKKMLPDGVAPADIEAADSVSADETAADDFRDSSEDTGTDAAVAAAAAATGWDTAKDGDIEPEADTSSEVEAAGEIPADADENTALDTENVVQVDEVVDGDDSTETEPDQEEVATSEDDLHIENVVDSDEETTSSTEDEPQSADSIWPFIPKLDEEDQDVAAVTDDYADDIDVDRAMTDAADILRESDEDTDDEVIEPALAGLVSVEEPSEISDTDNWSDDDLNYDFVEEFDDGTDDFADELDEDEAVVGDGERSSKGRLIAIVVLAIIAVILVAFIIYTLVGGRQNSTISSRTSSEPSRSTFDTTVTETTRETVEEVTTTEETTTEETTTEETTTEETTTEETTTEAPTEEEVPEVGSHTIAEGDNMWDIATRYYPDMDPVEAMNNIAQANGWDSFEDVVLVPGEALTLP